MNKYEGIEDFYNLFIQLEQIKRAGWIMNDVPAERIESVADHTLQVIMLALTLTNELKLDFDISKLSQLCLIHDIGEVFIGDISELDINYEEKKSKERKAVIKMLSSLSAETANLYFALWEEMEERKTDLAIFAYQVDKMDAVLKAKKYSEIYNMPELYEQFYNRQKNSGTFNYGPLSNMFKEIKPDAS